MPPRGIGRKEVAGPPVEPWPRIVPYGEGAVLVVLGETIDDAVTRRVHALAAAVRRLAEAHQDPLPGVAPPVPAYASLLVPFDPLVVDGAAVTDRLEALLASPAFLEAGGIPDDPAPLVEIPTRYGGRDGPDLADVAAYHSLRPADVVEAHASVEYRVHFVGFAPGFAYLGTLPEMIATPRRETPRDRVPAGSVGIADRQTGIYPAEGPGGWRIIGRTDLAVWEVRRDPPALLVPGARVRFVPVEGEDGR